ncbi:MAG: hypothetical protein ACRD1S_02330, partial [Vicinamibacterales bacterium]
AELRASAQPRFHLEMALLRWLHLRKLTPLAEVIAALEKGAPVPAPPASAPRSPPVQPKPPAAKDPEPVKAVEAVKPRATATPQESAVSKPREAARPSPQAASARPGGDFKDAFLAEVRRQKKFFYGTVVAQAQRIDVERERVTFVFGPNHRALRVQLDQSRVWLEALASEIAGRKVTVLGLEGSAPAASARVPAAGAGEDRQTTLKARALEDEGVQAMLDVFGAEIKNVEEM